MDSRYSGTPIVEQVVYATADLLGRDPFDLEPLGAVVDPALLQSFASSEAVEPESQLRFRYCGCEVCVGGSGEVEIERIE